MSAACRHFGSSNRDLSAEQGMDLWWPDRGQGADFVVWPDEYQRPYKLWGHALSLQISPLVQQWPELGVALGSFAAMGINFASAAVDRLLADTIPLWLSQALHRDNTALVWRPEEPHASWGGLALRPVGRAAGLVVDQLAPSRQPCRTRRPHTPAWFDPADDHPGRSSFRRLSPTPDHADDPPAFLGLAALRSSSA